MSKRIRLDKEIEKSLISNSIVITDNNNESGYLKPGLDGEVLYSDGTLVKYVNLKTLTKTNVSDSVNSVDEIAGDTLKFVEKGVKATVTKTGTNVNVQLEIVPSTDANNALKIGTDFRPYVAPISTTGSTYDDTTNEIKLVINGVAMTPIKIEDLVGTFVSDFKISDGTTTVTINNHATLNVNNDLGVDATGLVQQGYPLVKDTLTDLSQKYRTFKKTGSRGSFVIGANDVENIPSVMSSFYDGDFPALVLKDTDFTNIFNSNLGTSWWNFLIHKGTMQVPTANVFNDEHFRIQTAAHDGTTYKYGGCFRAFVEGFVGTRPITGFEFRTSSTTNDFGLANLTIHDNRDIQTHGYSTARPFDAGIDNVTWFKANGTLQKSSIADLLAVLIKEKTDEFNTASLTVGGNTVILTNAPVIGSLKVYRNGTRLFSNEYTISGTTVTFVVPFGASGGAVFSETVIIDYKF